ncbi:MAG TPA: phosphoribosyltransferase family protein [Bacteroidales bacterium]|nr:phosphoribosyltransferase family protein [Bacteroidales bacterium]
MGKSFEDILVKARTIEFAESFDMIVAIANGGIIPAALLNQRLNCGVYLLKLHLRDASQKKLYDKPRLVAEIDFDFRGKKILVVDDRVKTGTTLEFAKELLSGAALIKTFAVNGTADYCFYNEPCFKFPWIL